MNLSETLISEFAKITNDVPEKSSSVSLLGTVVTYEGVTYVKLDGTELLTPISTTVEINSGDRVTVDVGNHTARVTGNITSPSTSGDSVEKRLNIILDVVNDQIVAKVEESEEKLSQLIVSENAITALVSAAIQNSETGMTEKISSEIKQFADSITVSVKNSGTTSSMTIKGDGFEITSPSISFSGLVTYTALDNRGYTTLDIDDVKSELSNRYTTTTINGASIQTGYINAADVTLEGETYDYTAGQWKGGGVKTATGNDGTGTTYGAKLYGYKEEYYALATNAGVGLFRKSDPNQKAKAYLYVAGTSITASSPIKTVSDRNAKKDISSDMSRYEEFFHKLTPVYFKFIDGTSDRYHTGFIAQDVEQALLDSGLTTQDFAAFVNEHKWDGSTEPGLRYSEFIALNTHMIQKALAKYASLKEEVSSLRAEVEELKVLIKGGITCG